MSVLQLAQPNRYSAYRRTVAALADAVGRGGDNPSLIGIALLVSAFTALRMRLGK